MNTLAPIIQLPIPRPSRAKTSAQAKSGAGKLLPLPARGGGPGFREAKKLIDLLRGRPGADRLLADSLEIIVECGPRGEGHLCVSLTDTGRGLLGLVGEV